MNENQLKEAISLALKDDAVISKIAQVASKKILEEKAKVTNIEEELVRKCVVFGTDEGDYLTAAEVAEKIIQVTATDEELSNRRLGKALLNDAEEVKNTNAGRAYLVEGIVRDVKNYNPLPKDEKPELEVEEIEAEESEPDNQVSVTITEDAAEEISNKFRTLEQYEEHLEDLKYKKLLKHVEQYGYGLPSNLEKDEIVQEIVSAYENDHADLFESTDVLDEQDLSDLKPKKKKKDKKKKKKKNKE